MFYGKSTAVNNSRLLNSNYCAKVVRESEYLPVLQTLVIVDDSNRLTIAAASFILQRTWRHCYH